jgi:hypothetical protein
MQIISACWTVLRPVDWNGLLFCLHILQVTAKYYMLLKYMETLYNTVTTYSCFSIRHPHHLQRHLSRPVMNSDHLVLYASHITFQPVTGHLQVSLINMIKASLKLKDYCSIWSILCIFTNEKLKFVSCNSDAFNFSHWQTFWKNYMTGW